jgi:iron complex outermembrane recepter protein
MNRRTAFTWGFAFFCLFCLDAAFAQSAQDDLTALSLEDLMNVEVYSASKKSERFFNTAAAIYVITPEDIQRSGALSIPELLRMVPGINVQKVNAHSWDISARGFNGSIFSNKLLVLIDGRAVYTPLYGGVFWDVQDMVLRDIERIEVVRGPGGSLWGANAVNGVINIITKKAKDTQGTLVSVGGGTEERVFTIWRNGGMSQPKTGVDPWYYRSYVKYFNRDESYRASGTANDEWQMGRTGFKAERAKMTYQGDFYKGSLGQRTSATQFYNPYTLVLDKPAEVQGGNIMGKYEDDDWTLQGYWDVTDRDLQTFRETRQTFDLEYTKHIELSSTQEVTAGMGYRLNLEDTKDTDTISIEAPSELDQIFNIFAQDEIKMMDDKMRFIFGSKLEHNIYTHFEVQPSVRLSYEINEQNLVWTAASRSVRTPSRLETDGSITGATATPTFTRLVGSNELSSEKMRSFEVGYRTQPRENILLDLALFADHYDDIVTYTTGPSVLDRGFSVSTYPAANGLSGDIQGIELAGDIKITDWWKVKSSYTFAKSSLRTSPDVADIGLETALENSFPRHRAYMRSSFDLPSDVKFDATVRFTDSFQRHTVPSYTELDLTLTKVIKEWELSIVGQNLLRSHHLESAGSGIGLTHVERGGYIRATRKF